MKHQKLTMGLLAIGLITASATSLASGSFSGRAGSGIQDPYNYGKIVLHKKLICKSCPLPTDSFNKAKAKEVLGKVTNNAEDIQLLSHRERKAVAFYINKRFHVQ